MKKRKEGEGTTRGGVNRNPFSSWPPDGRKATQHSAAQHSTGAAQKQHSSTPQHRKKKNEALTLTVGMSGSSSSGSRSLHKNFSVHPRTYSLGWFKSLRRALHTFTEEGGGERGGWGGGQHSVEMGGRGAMRRERLGIQYMCLRRSK